MRLHHAAALEQAALELQWAILSLDRAFERTEDEAIRLLAVDAIALKNRALVLYTMARDELAAIPTGQRERCLAGTARWPGEKDPNFQPVCICNRPCAHHTPDLRAYHEEWGRRHYGPDYDPFEHLPCKCEPCPVHPEP